MINAKLEDAIAIGPHLIHVHKRAVMSDPTAKETKAMTQTVQPSNFQEFIAITILLRVADYPELTDKIGTESEAL